MDIQSRYSTITQKFPREFVLLQGQGCIWKKCAFCDYYQDTSPEAAEINRQVLARVTGKFGVLDVINSGSAPELDEQTLCLLEEIVRTRHIHTVWFEAHYLYHAQLAAFAQRFPSAEIKFRCGVESFDATQRLRWNKGIPAHVSPEDIARIYKGICLLTCVEGQSRESIWKDLETARKYFEYASINVFCNNSTSLHRDDALYQWFKTDVLPLIAHDPKLEILLENTDLGVG